jgi:hypothetical protein
VVIERLEEGLVEEGGVNNGSTDYIWIDVRGRSSILNVTSTIIGSG